jgi:hypothetical protein
MRRLEGCDAGGCQTGPEARRPKQRRQEIKVGGRAAKAVGRTKAAEKRPAAGRAQGGKAAAPAMAEAAAVSAQGATEE